MMPPKVKESVIRLMTRLAQQHGAVNLSQGFPNEPPSAKVRFALAHAVLSGNVGSGDEESRLSHMTEQGLKDSLVNLLTQSTTTAGSNVATDELNQYSPPMGRADVRHAVSRYYKRLYGYDVSEDNITLTLGATEAVATALRTVSNPGDEVVIFEPFHELYPSQCGIFYLNPVYVTLHASVDGKWHYDYEQLKDAIARKRTKALILNTPHNPTGKVFSYDELKEIVHLCIQNEVYIITDEIYEHMTFPDENGKLREHHLIPKEFPKAVDWTLVCNSIGKSASATGWRLGWCLHPPHLSDLYRGVHDQMVAMAPHPMQYASLAYFTLPEEYFKNELHVRYKSRVSILAEALEEVGFGIVVPEASYYLFADYRGVNELSELPPMEAAMYLMKEVGVATVPGDNFYGKAPDGQNYLRFACCRSLSDVTTAVKRLRAKLTISSP
mmetsp:Transcript_18958/g.39962  ORF Transcript_18958/g.39962 Transcript_18958/m.39962 type:complete len:440 (-) Transcript_18958:1147-2466(-)|eukprot:CAMPEP_0183731554 /NCGR_PEP_ID=MMETSP0737-20130205/35720_1 /TAXON_ID=385413 /ORGANISM="Thalassiosira miniscula, Strain CCMP1093" /LENGTH=439 /DNA_ID=CAMNT_0025964303 /DNA_START=92 /DNA_END=1411 /DNA_ORIENTATION=+